VTTIDQITDQTADPAAERDHTGNVVHLPRPVAALLNELTEALHDVSPSLPFAFRRLKDGRLGRSTSVGTALRHYRSGRWPVTDEDVRAAKLLRWLMGDRFDEDLRRHRHPRGDMS